MPQQNEREQLWQQLVVQISAEYLALDAREKIWISAACGRIRQLQQEMDLLFRHGDGLQQCSACRGDCCALGHNHLTLANLLNFLTLGDVIPALDYAATCPLLGSAGCCLPATLRPYNCISFLCDRIETRLPPAAVEQYYRLEKELRQHYQAFARRYAGGGMSGLLLAARRLEQRPFLQRLEPDGHLTPE